MPRFINRENGRKGTEVQRSEVQDGVENIVPDLIDKAVPIDDLTPDPFNARLHPERNMEAIKESLRAYGQRKPIVVRREGMIVVAGNGTLEAARSLGWTRIAASIQPMTDDEARGYGLADNRTAELAAWDFKVVAALDKLMAATSGDGMVGWSLEELAVLRDGAEPWQPPPVPSGDGQAWQDLWQGMPEFVQEDKTAYKSIVVHFKNAEDITAFEKLIGYSIESGGGTATGRSIWYPQTEIEKTRDKRYTERSK